MNNEPISMSHLAIAIAYLETSEKVCNYFGVSEEVLMKHLADPELTIALEQLGCSINYFRKETEARRALEEIIYMANPDSKDAKIIAMRQTKRHILNAVVKSAQIILEDAQKRKDIKTKANAAKVAKEKDDPLTTLHDHYLQAKES
jgi:hypothetical protein